MSIEIKPYATEFAEQWNELCRRAKNGLFIFDRSYMEYHSHRFVDDSALIFLKGQLVAVFPASREVNNTIISHAGLTFGGLVSIPSIRAQETIAIVGALSDYYRNKKGARLVIKSVPAVFDKYPSGDINYALWINRFSIIRRDLSSILPLNNPLPFNSLKKRGVKAAVMAGVQIQVAGFSKFHALLTHVLETNHGVAPVHTLKELELLKSRFPKNIELRAAYVDGDIVAGTIVYKYGHVWHTQYLASSEIGKKVGGLDFVIYSLIDEARKEGCEYLSFGASTTQAGKVLNEGLIWQKESYGARGLTHDYYALNLTNES